MIDVLIKTNRSVGYIDSPFIFIVCETDPVFQKGRIFSLYGNFFKYMGYAVGVI